MEEAGWSFQGIGDRQRQTETDKQQAASTFKGASTDRHTDRHTDTNTDTNTHRHSHITK